MNAIILSVGDELVLGQTVDTNSAWISQQLAAVGVSISAHATLPDDLVAIEGAIRNAVRECDVLIISGGIGPTEDDLTRQALAKVLRVPLDLSEQWLARLQSFFEKLGRKMPETNRIQAMIPRGTRMIENTCGTAAGIHANIAHDTSPDLLGVLRSCDVYVMPGVPKEMKAMFARDVLPQVAGRSRGAVILSRTLHTFGLGESSIAEKLGPLMKRDRNPSVGTTVSHGIVSLRVNSRFGSRDQAAKHLDDVTGQCRAALGDLIFGADDDTLPKVIAAMLAPSRMTVTTAESCTGGLLATMLTDISGSSDYFKQGWVTYSNEAKRDRLGVSENLLNVYGAVSEPVVEAMARAARRLAKSDHALAISGIAGPTGGTEQKPVGTVCIALAYAKPAASTVAPSSSSPSPKLNEDSDVLTRTFHFTGDREMIRDRSAKMALTMLRFHLLGKPLPF